MIKNYSGHLIGLLVAISFFLLLAYIVKPSSESLKTENSFRVVDFIRLKKDTSLKEKSRNIFFFNFQKIVDYDVQLLGDLSVDLVITVPLDVLHSSAPVSL